MKVLEFSINNNVDLQEAVTEYLNFWKLYTEAQETLRLKNTANNFEKVLGYRKGGQRWMKIIEDITGLQEHEFGLL